LFAIQRGKLHRVSSVLKVFEIHAFDNATTIDIETGNNPDRQSH
jgi:hypothetical protein